MTTLLADDPDRELDRIRWVSNIPFWAVHVAAVVCLFMVGLSWAGVGVAAISYTVRMFAITGGYHRYFSHRTYKTSRAFQFFLALLGVTATQKGPLWWASHHRRHHKYSDQPEDIHSPRRRGFFWSHVLWIMVKRHKRADRALIKDFAAYPELRFLDKWERPLVGLMVLTIGLTLGFWWLVWLYLVPQVLLWHCTFFINSLAHVWGRVRYETGDDSKNSALLAVMTLGEGWHNNHHHYQRTAQQGFFWWEIDVTYYILKGLQTVGLIWDVTPVPRHIRDGVTRRPAAVESDSPATQPDLQSSPP